MLYRIKISKANIIIRIHTTIYLLTKIRFQNGHENQLPIYMGLRS